MATRIYLAGPQVFLPDALDVGGRKQKLCDHYGFVGVFPLDVVIDIENLPPEKAALKISRGNEELIRSCDLAIADMTPYRGPSADVGTAYEMGFARGMGLPVLAYTNVPQLFVERTTAAFGGRVERGADGRLRDAEGMALEEWGMVDNLMLDGAVLASGGTIARGETGSQGRYRDLHAFEECLRQAQRILGMG